MLAVIAATINGSVALILLRAGKRLRSITLEADGKHLLTVVWTTRAHAMRNEMMRAGKMACHAG